jgi:hypothetical protein
MRNISFFLTQRQVREQTKTVTRRLGWHWLRAGTLLQPVVKGQGIPRGGKVEKIGGPIRVVSVERERLNRITADDVRREGFDVFPGYERWDTNSFIRMFCEHNGCAAGDYVTRIEFEYTEPRRDRRRWDR